MILLVEDDENDVSLILRTVDEQSPNTAVRVAKDGAEALYLLENWDTDPPLLILLGLQIPKVSGLQVLERLRQLELTRHVPVVMLGSSGDDHDVARSYDLGANSFLSKNGPSIGFRETVSQVIPYWLQLNHPYIHPGVSHR